VNLHGPVRAAEFEGTAEVTLTLDGWKGVSVSPTAHTLKVLPPKAARKAEPVSARVVKSLVFANKKGTVAEVRFHPDGSKLYVADLQWVQVWDTKTWKEAVRIEPLVGITAGSMMTALSADWGTVLHAGAQFTRTRGQRDGKPFNDTSWAGRVELHDSASKAVKESVQFLDRGPNLVYPSPDGKTAVVTTLFPQELAGPRRDRTELWDWEKGTHTVLADTAASAAFTADGSAILLARWAMNAASETESSLVRYDLKAGKVTKTTDAPKGVMFAGPVLSPDGKTLAVSTVHFKTQKRQVLFLDAVTFDELGRVAGPEKPGQFDDFQVSAFTADSSLVAVRCGTEPAAVWDAKQKKVVRTVPVGDSPTGPVAISADGKRLAVGLVPAVTVAEMLAARNDPRDLGQSRVLLVDLSDPNAEPEAVALPAGPVSALAFSADGKTLAAATTGAVQILDLTAPRK
jgi:WD40 repeat protein